ncbi:MAG: hypothetical protein HY291_01045 [Planctomycetes bacterium]|nr:hypothetical protein [Planctomycetota bacterium]
MLLGEEPAATPPHVPPAATEPPPPTHAVLLPAESMLFLETSDAKRLQERWCAGPLCKAWSSPPLQDWWAKHKQTQMKDAERETLACIGRMLEAADGTAAFAFAPPALIEELASSPPAVILAAQRKGADANRLAERVRALRDRLVGDEKPRARPGPDPWQIEETDGSQVAYREHAVMLTFQAKVFQTLFKGLQSPPKNSLEPRVLQARALLPESDLTLHIARNGLKELAAAGFVLEEEHIKVMDALGFAKGSHLDGAIRLTPEGFHERHRLNLTNGEGLLAVLAKLPPLSPVAAEVVGAEAPPDAIEMLPPHAAAWFSLRGDLSARGPELAKALLALSPDLKVRIQSFEKLSGASLADLLAQVQAPAELAVVFKSLGEELPKAPPIECMASLILKDPKPMEAALEALAKTPETFIGKEELSGGTYYFVKDNPAKPGWWLKGTRLFYASWSQGLELGLAALEHKTGTERLTDRPDVRRLLAANAIQEHKTFMAYADAAQLLELPYQAARATMGSDDPENKWPAFHTFSSVLGRVFIQFGPAEDRAAGPGDKGTDPKPATAHAVQAQPTAELDAETPTSLVGLLQAFRIAFEEAGW